MKAQSKTSIPSASTPSEKVTGYKGFNRKFQCTPEGKVFQYQVGKTFYMLRDDQFVEADNAN